MTKPVHPSKHDPSKATPDMNWIRTDSFEVDGVVLREGDLFKVKNNNSVFFFKEHVLNTDNSRSWVTCFIRERGGAGAFFSFSPDIIVPIKSKKRRR